MGNDGKRALDELVGADLRQLAALIPDNIIVLDRDERIRFINWTVPDLTVDQVIGTLPYDYLPPDQVDKTRDCYRGVLETGEERHVEMQYVAEDGSVSRWVTRARPIVRDDEVEGVLVVSTNVTARDQAIFEKRALEARLHQTQKMEAVGQLAGGIAHDFNNLLLAIMLNTDLALKKSHNSEIDAHLADAKLAIDRAVDLTRQLLTFGRRQPIHVERIELNLLTGRLMKMLRRTISEQIALELDPGEQLPAFRADVVQVEQVLMNLCINARDAVEGSGRIIVATGVTEVENPARQGRYVFVSVADDGVGMTPEVRERVFEPFFTTKGPGQGTGLGLAVVYGIVENHGGFIQVEAQPAGGTKFTVFFPADESLEAPVVTHADELDAPGGTETILVAEDAPAVRKVVVTVLETAGYRVLTAGDGEESLELVRAHGDGVSLALLDVVMPRLSGPEAAAQIRESHPNIEILFTTGYSDTTMLGPEDAAALVRKPYDPRDLLRRVRAAIDRN